MKYPQSLSMPSAVSDWLEEQLESRGIDAVHYSRYILSLFHTHTLDVIYPEDDLQFTRLRKEVRRSSGCSKKVRRWRHAAQADAEQLKRSAAVECLMSASDQNCEIESLVDELCEKLKDVNNAAILHEKKPSPTPLTKKISPQELAEKYYAAFPPLCPEGQQALLTNIIPQWIAVGGSPKKNKKKSGKHCDVMKTRANQTYRQRLSYNNNPKKENCTATLKTQHFGNNNNYEHIFEAYDMNNWEFFNDTLTPKDAPKPPKDTPKTPKDAPKTPSFEQNNDQIVVPHEENMYDTEDMLYEDLPVDISDLLSDTPDETNCNTLRDPKNEKQYHFIQCGTNITSSIWSNDEKNDNSEQTAGFSTGSWPVLGAAEPQNDVPMCDNEQLFDVLTMSLLKINHNKEKSGFTEIIPQRGANKSGPSSLSLFQDGGALFRSHKNGAQTDKEDLLTSERSHFKPINEKTQGQYENGATFVISNSIDKVDYKRSESGTMYLENKKYREYREKDPPPTADEQDPDFVLKFCVCQNDIACQTDTEHDVKTPPNTPEHVVIAPLDYETIEQEAFSENPSMSGGDFPGGESQRPESVMCEVATWKYDAQYCEKCNNNNNEAWKKGGAKGYDVWDNSREALRNIWDGKEVCHTCLRLNGGGWGTTTPQNSLLREDISQDGEQLLSDLSSLQKTYMEALPPPMFTRNPDNGYASMETDDENCDVTTSAGFGGTSALFGGLSGYSENESWSFASRLEEDCLGAMTSLPTLRSVTL